MTISKFKSLCDENGLIRLEGDTYIIDFATHTPFQLCWEREIYDYVYTIKEDYNLSRNGIKALAFDSIIEWEVISSLCHCDYSIAMGLASNAQEGYYVAYNEEEKQCYILKQSKHVI